MKTTSIAYLKHELAIILQDYTDAQYYLPVPVKAALNLKRYAHFSDAEIARQLRISVAAAQVL